MASVDMSLEALVATRRRLIELLHEDITGEEKQFLISFKKMKPDWSHLFK